MTAAASRSVRTARASTPAESSASAPDVPRLRLAAARGTLGLELDAPFAMRPIVLSALSLTFPNIRFPIDLSGGVTRFRHRRGALAQLALEAAPADVATWVAPKLRGLLRDGTPEIWLSAIEGGFAVGLADGDAALAFDVLVVPSGGALVLVPERARGIGLGGTAAAGSGAAGIGLGGAGATGSGAGGGGAGGRAAGVALGAPPHALALRVLAAALAPVAAIEAGALRIPEAAAVVLRAVLPAAGARAPSTIGCAWDVPRAQGDRLRIEAQIDAPPPALPDRVVRANETLLLAADADHAAYRGDPERAREGYLSALERAPRHPEISERLAWLDATLGDRAEAALSTLVDVTPAAFAGLLGAELLAAVGDAEGGRGALARAAPAEPFGPLAARMWMRAAALAEDLRERLAALDEAVARAPALADARWARLAGRLTAVDPRGALADAEHLEAAARGARARHHIALRAARAFLVEGFATEAHKLFERALRYVPDDPEAVAGLARTLAAQGARRRALDLFARALALTERAGGATSAVAIDLAKALVDVASDRPAAIARVRIIPASAPEAAEARLLEARWRAELGDLAGAGLAIGRLRDHVERVATTADAAATAALLAEAATIDERLRDDLAGAQRDLGLALRFAPKDARLSASFRRVARDLARRAAASAPSMPSASGPAMPPPPRRAAVALRARAPSPLPPVPQPPPSVDLGVELPEIGRDPLDEPSDLEVELPTMRPGAFVASEPPPHTAGRAISPPLQPSRDLPLDDDATYHAAARLGEAELRFDAPPRPDEDDATQFATPDGDERDDTGDEESDATHHAASEEEEGDAYAEDEALAERLADRLRGNPRDRATVLALADVLDRLGRDMELFALLSARIDEGDEDERRALSPARRAVLARLAARARSAGNISEAELYEMMLEGSPP